MAQRKLQQEIDRTFKRVAEGITAFEGLFEKINATNNSSQKEKLEDALKREIKKLQRQRDQIKTWAASNEIKDKKPLLDHRKLIETQMEKFKAVEKEMKTKAYSKEGLSLAAKMDPKEQEKAEMGDFIQNMVADLDRQTEQFEAESETLQATLRKGRKDTSKAERVAELERMCERHRWHQGKLELILRLIENGGLEVQQVKDMQEDIKYYVEFCQDGDFAEDEDIYEGLNLEEEEENYGVGLDNDRTSSADAQSVQDEPPEKPSKTSEPPASTARRASTQMKSPLPISATLSTITNGGTMKPAPAPPRIAGETLKYSSAAAAAAASDKNVGIAPLPPPPGLSGPQPSSSSSASAMSPPTASASIAPMPAPTKAKDSPRPAPSIPAEAAPTQSSKQSTPAPSIPPTPLMDTVQTVASSTPATQTPASSYAIPVAVPHMQRETSSQSSQPSQAAERAATSAASIQEQIPEQEEQEAQDANEDWPNDSFFATPTVPMSGRPKAQHRSSDSPKNLSAAPSVVTNGTHGLDRTNLPFATPTYNLPPGLRDLVESFQAVRAREMNPTSAESLRLLNASAATLPLSQDAERPNQYKPPTEAYHTPPHYPQEVPAVFDDEMLVRKVDTDTLFYIFYYCQGTYQQFLAAAQLKRLSWRFHKQYQTWFQRHEEPRAITEEYEQGTYRFFDYESTWMNRRKSDFKFAYKFLEDDIPT